MLKKLREELISEKEMKIDGKFKNV